MKPIETKAMMIVIMSTVSVIASGFFRNGCFNRSFRTCSIREERGGNNWSSSLWCNRRWSCLLNVHHLFL